MSNDDLAPPTPIDAKEWLNLADTKSRLVQLRYRADSKKNGDNFNYGCAQGYIVDPQQRIAVLLANFPFVHLFHLQAGDFVRYKAHHPEVTEYVIDTTATTRHGDPPLIPFPSHQTPSHLDH